MNSEKRKRYSHDWELISNQIKFTRAKNKCEWCGLANGTYIRRFKGGQFQIFDANHINGIITIRKRTGKTKKQLLKFFGITQVSLSVAHLNHIEKDDRPENLKCGCQRCHLMHDRIDNRIRQNKTSLNPSA